ncbi:MAG: GTP 3',8-cyclase MoaA [Elusimicrobia bacterium]|nr:GTP 3',8-cyclase MoaA [Elusimicrobiota bacterium]
MLSDGLGRTIEYLRLSVTDRCNLRCVYCLPEVAPRFSPGADLLSDDEIVELVSAFARMGVSKIRLTGGEPLVRPGLPGLVRRLSRIAGVNDLSLSTNGVLLGGFAHELKAAGLSRVNISLDTLDPARFAKIARFGALNDVLSGIEAALDARLAPVKLNVVVAKGMNDDEIGAFAALTDKKPLHVRFIELMPMGETGFFSAERRVPLGDMLSQAAPLAPASPEERPLGHGPARYYRRPGASGTIGFISALSCGFCDACNRVRLSASGTLIPCLDGEEGVDLRTPLRASAGVNTLMALIREAIRNKPGSHDMVARLAAPDASPRFMCSIGG